MTASENIVTAFTGNQTRTAGKSAARGKTLAGKYLTFKIGQEDYGIEILKVQEIVKFMNATRVPNAPPYVKGIINLRGKVIPVQDLKEKFGQNGGAFGEKACIIIVNSHSAGDQEQMTLGALVDEVSEVCNFAESQIEPPPDFGTCMDNSFLLGVAKGESKIVFLLDIDKALFEASTLHAKEEAATAQP